MADAPPPADLDAAAARWGSNLGVQHSGEANGETSRADSPRFRPSYISDNASDGIAADGVRWSVERGEARPEDRTLEDGGLGSRYEEEEEEEEEDEDDDWMAAHLATLETKRRESTSMQEVEASVRAALSILNQSSDGADASQHDEDEEGEEGEKRGEEGDSGRARYFDFVQEAMEARWSLGSPNRHLLSEEGAHAFEPGVHEIQESEEEDGDEEEVEGGQWVEDIAANSKDAASAAIDSGAAERKDGVEGEHEEDTETQDNEVADNQADDEWQEAYTAKGRVYYYNRRTRESSWNKPAKFRASSRPQSPETGSATPHRVIARQSLGYHASSSDSPRSLASQQHLFCCFCGTKHEPRQFQAHFRACKSLNFHKKQSTELYRGFQKMLTVLSEDSSLRVLHYASSFPDAQPVLLSASMQDNLLLLRRRQSTQRSRPSTPGSRRSKTLQSVTRADRDSRMRTPDQKKKSRPLRNGNAATPTSAGARAKAFGGFPLEVETCRYCGRSFAEGRLSKHEAVCPRVFGNEGSWGRGTPSTATASSAGQATTSPASKKRGTAHRKLKTARSLTDAHTLEASYKEHQAALVVCPCCRRKFAPSGAQQHIAICKSVQNRPKNPLSLLKDYAMAG